MAIQYPASSSISNERAAAGVYNSIVADARHRERALVIALLLSMILWNLPFGGFLLYPFKLLATWLHEMSHGFVMMISGAGFDYLEIYRDTSGIAHGKSAVGPAARAAISCAGYMGAATFGALFLVLGQSRRGARSILAAIGVALALSALIWVRNPFGEAAVGIGAGVCVLLAVVSGEKIAVYAVNFVAAQSCINAVLDVRVLFRTEMVINGDVVRNSDAHNMASATFGNHWLWAAAWLLFSFAAFYLALRRIRQLNVPSSQTATSGSDRSARPTEEPPDGSDCSDPHRSPASAQSGTAPSG